LGASEYLAVIHHQVAGKPPEIDWQLEKLVQSLCRHGIHQSWISSAHDCSEGGLAVALAEACISGSLGAEIRLGSRKSQRWDESLFGELGSQILVSIPPSQEPAWLDYLQSQGQGRFWEAIGQVTATGKLKIWGDDRVLLETAVSSLTQTWQSALEKRMS
jgi:phosphoribosylformylglycinamidine synthase